MMRYVSAAKKNAGDNLYAKGSDTTIKDSAINMAKEVGISPDAIGRFFLKGWSLSLSISKTSLSRYVADEKTQNSEKAAKLIS